MKGKPAILGTFFALCGQILFSGLIPLASFRKGVFLTDLDMTTKMRISHVWLLFSWLMLPALSSAQSSGIDAALNKGNAQDLGIYFSRYIDLSLPDLENSYPTEKAVEVLSEFFTRQSVKGYKRNHLSTPQEGRSNYSIGDLYTAQGTFRITLYFDSQKKITEIRIQK
jgi:Domain of unknown function (DUF4783)